MRKYLLLSAVILIHVFTAFAQWMPTDLGTGGTGQKLEVIDEATAFITQSKGKILKTIDGGESWIEVVTETLAEETLFDINFGNDQIGIVTTRSDFIIRTVDQGESWEKIPLTAFSDGSGDMTKDPGASENTSIRTEAICFYDADTAFVSLSWKDSDSNSHAYVWRSTNGGEDWSQLPFDINDLIGTTSTITYNGIEFPEGKKDGYLIGTRGSIIRLKNIGEQVEKVDVTDLDIAGKSINDIYCEGNVIYLSTQVGLYKTEDNFATIGSLTDVYAFDAIVLSDGTILQGGATSKDATRCSRDQGQNWLVAENGTGTLFELEYFNGLIYGLSTSGKVYTLPPSHLLDPVVDFEVNARGKIVEFDNTSENVGSPSWQFGDDSTSVDQSPDHLFQETGSYWVKLTMENALGAETDSLEVEINSMVVDFDHSFAGGNIVEFTQACDNYYEIVKWDFDDGQFSEEEDPDHVFGQLGTYHVKLYASDGKDTLSVEVPVDIDEISTPWFFEQSITSNTLSRFVAADDQNAVITGNNTTILCTGDGGLTWSDAVLPDDIPAHNASDIAFFDEMKGLASYSAKRSVNGFLLKTDDAGKSWTELPLSNLSTQAGDSTDITLGAKVYFYGLEAIDATTAFVVTRWEYEGRKQGYIFKTTDGGASWDISSGNIYDGFSSVYSALEFSPDKQTAVLTGVKKLWISNDGGQTWVAKEAVEYGSINDAVFLNDTTILLAAQYGTIRSTDRGATWSKVDEDYSFDVIAVNDSTLFTGKNEATCKVSKDFGESWELAGLGIGSAYYEFGIYNDKLFVLCSRGKVYSYWLDNIYPAKAKFEQIINDEKSSSVLATATFSNQSENATSYHWDFGDGTTSNTAELQVEHQFPDYGSYDVTLIASNRTKRDTLKQTILINNVGIEDFVEEQLVVYPNPCRAREELTVDWNSSTQVTSVSIIDAIGNVILHEVDGLETGALNVEMNDLSPGMYFVVIIDKQDRQTIRKLIVK